MKAHRHHVIAVFLALFAGAVARAETAAKPGVEAVAWLAGHWRMERNGRVVEEQWMAPAGGAMLGVSRTVEKGKLLEHEFLLLQEGPGGDLFYVAMPVRRKETAFQLKSLGPKEVVFENPGHDFPQRIHYALRPDGALLAAIEGVSADGTTRRIEFLYRRANP